MKFPVLQYDIVGHSGDGYNITLVESGKVPKNNKQRLEILKVNPTNNPCWVIKDFMTAKDKKSEIKGRLESSKLKQSLSETVPK